MDTQLMKGMLEGCIRSLISYKITDEGLVYLREFKHSYYKITGIVEKILEDKE